MPDFDLKAHLQTLSETHAPSGHEAPIRAVIREAWTPLVDEFDVDGLGSLIAIKRATNPTEPRRKIMLAAHMDEIGMLVRDIVDGFIFVNRISGVDARLMPAQTVRVQGKRPLSGVVVTTPPHLLPSGNNKKYPKFDELIIDVGLPAAEVADLVAIGDVVTMDVPMIDLLNGRVAGKAMDDRACVAAVTACLHELQSVQHHWDVYAAATVQEETGLYGAATAAYRIDPDVAIALDVTFAAQPGVDGDLTFNMGGGPVIAMGANFHPKLYDKLIATARQHEIAFQEEAIAAASGTDAWAIQVARQGIPTALLGIPLRSMHSSVETVELKDITRAGRLLTRFIASLDADFMTTIAYDGLPSESASESA